MEDVMDYDELMGELQGSATYGYMPHKTRFALDGAADAITTLRAEIASRDAALVKAREELTECAASLDRLQSNSEKLLAEARRARAEALEEAAVAGYIACAETRHVRLGDRVATAIRARASQGDGA
jgi:hypothetical protein